MVKITELQDMVAKFRDERDWRQFHTPKNLAQALASEVGELNDLYLWDREPDVSEVGQEMADIMIYLLSLADVTGIDLIAEVIRKIHVNSSKYPVGKSLGRSEKSTQL